MSYDLLAIRPKNEKMFDAVCKDIAADIITIPYEDKINFLLKKTQVNEAIDKGTFFEINYGEFIKDNSKRSNFISNVLMLLDVTKGKNLIISSGVNSFLHHRSPYDLITM
jgi:ribonuclease P/MRP protein subunit RPP1